MDPPGQLGGMGSGRFAGFEAPAFVAGLDDVAVVGEPVKQRDRHLGVAEDDRRSARPGRGGSLPEARLQEVQRELRRPFTSCQEVLVYLLRVQTDEG